MLESVDAAVLVESDSAGVGRPMGHLYTLAEKASGLLQPVLAINSMGHLHTLVQQEVFPRTGRPAFHAMEVFVHRRHVPNCTTCCER